MLTFHLQLNRIALFDVQIILEDLQILPNLPSKFVYCWKLVY